MMAPWLRRHLENAGLIDTDGITRTASGTHCRTCQAPVLRGLDADRLALVVTVDTTDLDPLGEVLALATGRHTYAVRLHAGKLQLTPRGQFAIAAGPGRHPVLAAHQCNSPPLPARIPDRWPEPEKKTADASTPPF